MSIRFRCAHCNQLLGIADSRAGASVDCPGCGRTVRVPDPAGKTAAPSRRAPGSDPKLNEALSELTALGADIDDGLSPATLQPQIIPTSPVSRPPVVPTSPTERRDRDDRSPDLKPAAIRRAEPTVGESQRTDDGTDGDRARQMEQSLRDLAATGESAESDPRTTPIAFVRRDAVVAGAGLGIGILLGLVAAWLLNADGSSTEDAAADRSEAAAEKGERPQIVRPAVSGHLAGRVLWSEPGRDVAGDDGALVLLLPDQRTGRWRLDSRPLRDAVDSHDYRASIAALKELGVSVAIADGSGEFLIERLTDESVTLLVISRHVNQNDEALSRQAIDTLSRWFENPAQLIGQLAAKTVPQPAVNDASAEPIVVRFP